MRRFAPQRTKASPTVEAALIAQAYSVLTEADEAHEDAFLALCGDKRFLFSDSGRSFLMFGVRGRAWLAIGDAIGVKDEAAELERRFIAEARACGGWPAFYAVDEQAADRLRAAGLDREKVGERAIIDLSVFSLRGDGKKDLRNVRNRAVKAGCRFEIVSPGQNTAFYETLRPVSDAWLAMRGGAEKAFSMGRFDPDYLRHFHIALARRRDTPVAFANIWRHRELATLDLMRFADEGPGGGMDYLFTEMVLWAQAQGLKEFDLGLAPLAGLKDQAELSTVAHLGSFIYARGGRFYGFEGLRRFKNKFDPVWEPSFICARNDWRIAAAAIGVASLTGGGIRGLLRRTRAA
jgi:lysylphosphatidylglycerol synthetase-like protein (DUF2156 family)